MSLSDSMNDLFVLANMRRSVEGGDPYAVKIAAAMFGSNSPASTSLGSIEPGTGADANNLTSAQNAYAPNMPAGAYGAAIPKAQDAEPKQIGDKKQPKPSNFSASSFKAND